jgi:trehalose/maltose hydrolase-like predicted phosphorylase
VIVPAKPPVRRVRVSTGNAYGDCEEHINADISFAARQMWQLSHDKSWLADTGYPLAAGIARFWASKATNSSTDGMYHIFKVMGPDEFHGLTDDNAYTNAAAATALRFAADAADVLSIAPAEKGHWLEIAEKMFIPYDAALDYHPEYMNFFGPKSPASGSGVYAPPVVVKQVRTLAEDNAWMFH